MVMLSKGTQGSGNDHRFKIEVLTLLECGDMQFDWLTTDGRTPKWGHSQPFRRITAIFFLVHNTRKWLLPQVSVNR
jgi:hypothetical protein